ncbi:MAG: glycosyltransferase family 4 protein, partial [Candidatus Diapherotrites archaeon]
MQIDFLIPRNPFKEFAGIENNTLNIIYALKNKGYKLKVITTDIDNNSFEKDGIRFICYKREIIGKEMYFSIGTWLEILNSKADIIYANGFNNLVTFAGLLFKKQKQKLILWLASSGSSSFLRKILWIPYLLIFNLLAKRIDQIICISEFEKENFEKLLFMVHKNKFEVVPIGIHIENFRKIKIKQRDKNLIISVGRLVKNKGFLHLLKAFKIAKKMKPNLKLKIIGDGPQKNELEKFSKENNLGVNFLGEIGLKKSQKLIKLYKKAALFVLLSDYESQGVAVAEAITAETPCIVS